MARSSNSLPTSPLPFGADTHSHNAYRRSTTVLGGPYDEAQQDQQDYVSFVAAAQAEDARANRASASIPPTSVRDLPLGHITLLRRHKILLWVLLVAFEISLIVATVAIALCAVHAHDYNSDGGAKAAFVIIAVFGFAGMLGSAAVGWLTWQGRKERARLEKRWTADEEMKERRSVREQRRASEVLRSIKERERSLSRSRSRSRGRPTHRPPQATRDERPYSELIPSFRELTPTASGAPSAATEPVGDSEWTNRLDLSTSEDEGIMRSSGQITNERLEKEIFEHLSRPTTPINEESGSPNIGEVILGSSPTLLNSSSSPTDGPVPPPQDQSDASQGLVTSPHSPTLFDFSGNYHAPTTPPPQSPLPAVPGSRSSPMPGRPRQLPSIPGSYKTSPIMPSINTPSASPIIDPAGGIHPAYRESNPFGLPLGPRSSRQTLNEAAAATAAINSSPPLRTTSHRQPPADPRSYGRPSTLPSPTLLNSPPVDRLGDSAAYPAHRISPTNDQPTNPQTTQQKSSPTPKSGSGTTSTLLNSSSSPHDGPTGLPHPPPPATLVPTNLPTTPTAPRPLFSLPTPTHPPPAHASTPPPHRSGTLPSSPLSTTQSDDNFLANLELGSRAGSEDSAITQARATRSQERVQAWAASSASLDMRAPYLTGREEDPGMVRRGWRRVEGRVGRGLRGRFR